MSAAKHTLTPTMLRELRWIEKWGAPGDLADYGSLHLAFHAREKVLTALRTRGLIEPDVIGYRVTAEGRAAIAKAVGGEEQRG